MPLLNPTNPDAGVLRAAHKAWRDDSGHPLLIRFFTDQKSWQITPEGYSPDNLNRL